jgi:hypothetical protein
MRAYNLFRRKGEADLFCAVPEDIPVPAFVTPGGMGVRLFARHPSPIRFRCSGGRDLCRS